MKRNLYVFLILFSFSTTAYSQESALQKGIINSYDKIEIDDKEITSVEDIKKLRDQSQKINFTKGILRGTTLLQKIAVMQNEYVLSEKYGSEAEIIANEIKDNAALSAIWLYRGKVNIILDQYPEAEAKLNQSVSYAERMDNQADKHIQLCRIYANFAGMYEGMGKTDDWYNANKKSLKSIETTPANNLTEYQKSKYYYLYIFELMNMGNFYGYAYKTPKPELAEPYFKRVMEFQKSAPEYFKIMEIDVYESMSSFYITKKEYRKAIDYANKLLHVEKVKKSPRDRLFAYRDIKEAYKFLNNTTEENKYLRLYTSLNDSINSVEKNTIVQQSRNEIKKADVKNSKKINNLLWATGAIIVLMALSSLWFIRRKNKIMRVKYEQMIEKLKNESALPSDTADDIEDTHDDDNDSAGESEISASKYTISTETETRLLKKLNAFEKSDKFLRKDITIGLVAGQMNTNAKYLSEIIRNQKLMNFNNYINTLRINYIVHKLYNEPKYREYKVSYLAEECGYASSQVFVIAFKKISGVTPSYFIQSLKEDHSLVYN